MNYKTSVLSAILCAGICALSAAQEASVEAKIDAVFERWNRPDSAGAVVGVVKDGALVFAKGYGMENVAAGKHLGPASRMNLGSTSKQFAAASIVLLAQEGKLSLDDDIRKWLPEMPDYGNVITIRHLIHHTSGLRDYLALHALAGLSDESSFGNQEVLDIVARQKELNFNPGEEFLYSNTGYVLLAIIVKRASGMTLTQFAQQRIFDPLGMAQTCVDTDLSIHTDTRALSYATRGANIPPANRLDVVEGDGNIMSTVGDLAKWDANFYEPKVGGQALIDQMLIPGVLNNGEKIDYAFGLVHDTVLGRPTLDHGGSWLGFRAQFTRFPQDHLSVIVLCNMATMNPDALVEEVAKIYLGESASTESGKSESSSDGAKPKKRDLKAKTGRYFVENTGTLVIVDLEDDALRVEVDTASVFLAAIDARRFRPATPTSFAEVEFDTEGSAEPSSITVKSASGRTQTARRVSEDVPSPKPEELAGTYYSPEIDVEYTIAVKGGAAEITRPNAKPATLEPIHADWFRASFRYHFERDSAGKITGFRASLGRVKNILFEKRK